MTVKLEELVYNLITHARSRCGAGFGSYPTGVRYALGAFLQVLEVDPDYRPLNGYGEPCASLGEALEELDERLRQ